MGMRWQVAQAAEIRWWQNYLKKKDPVEYRQWKTDYWNNLLEEYALQPKAGESILDAGCGPAGIFMSLDTSQNQVTALDPLLDQYAEHLTVFKEDFYPDVRFVTAPLEQPLDSKYDRIYCLNAINHVADLELCLRTLRDGLKQGGTLILSTDVHRRAWLKPIFKVLPGDILHPQQHSDDEYRELLDQLGFDLLRSDVIKYEYIFEYRMYVLELR